MGLQDLHTTTFMINEDGPIGQAEEVVATFEREAAAWYRRNIEVTRNHRAQALRARPGAGRSADLLRADYAERRGAVDAQVRQGAADGIAILDRRLAMREAQIATARHPLRDCGILPLPASGLKRQTEIERRDRATMTGEVATAKAIRLIAKATQEEAAGLVTAAAETGDMDLTGSLVDAALARWQKPSKDLAAVVDGLEVRDFFKVRQLESEAGRIRDLLARLRRLQACDHGDTAEEVIASVRPDEEVPSRVWS